MCLMLASCDEDDDDFEARDRGELGNGHFEYLCLNDTDSACLRGVTGTFPSAVAVGSRFEMSFAVRSGAQPTVIAPASAFVRQSGRSFEVLREGQFALLAVTGNSEVVDIKHLRAAKVSELRLDVDSQQRVARVVLAEQQSASLVATPVDRRGIVLGGALTYSWRSSDESCVSVESIRQLNRVSLRAKNACVASLLTEVSGTTFAFPVQVGGALPDAGSSIGSDAGTGFVGAIDGGAWPASIDGGSGDAQTVTTVEGGAQ